MSNEIHVVIRGCGEYITDVHGVYMYERRAEVAAEELGRMSEGDEWASVLTFDPVLDPIDDSDEEGVA